MKFPQPELEFIKNKMLFITKLNMKTLYVDENLNRPEMVVKNLFEMSYVNALKLHSILASLYFAKNKDLPKDFLKMLISKICIKTKRIYSRMTKNKFVTEDMVLDLVKYGYFCVFKEKYGSFYNNYKFPFVKKSNLPLKMLKDCLKNRGTNKIISHSFQRI